MPFVFLPLARIFKHYGNTARKMRVLRCPFDIIDGFIPMAAFILFLLPTRLANLGRAHSRREILFLAPIVGLWICCVREFKCSHLFLAFPLMTLGTSLKVHFRDSDSDIGYMSMCQTCITFASDIMVVGEQMALIPAETAKDQWAALNVGGYVAQMKFLPGTEERDAINFVYDYSPMYGHIAAMAILVFTAP
ncbi:hypothetical protein PDIDSM_757 [Penicillium digitatum]|nr:hypothetical protein PDIDSM_757 [Penicillium digitatum]